MSQHTQGPWFHKDHSNGKNYVYPKSGLNPICEIFNGYDNNIDLIAAAPELLDQIERVYNWLYGCALRQEPTPDTTRQMLNELESVISKAKTGDA